MTMRQILTLCIVILATLLIGSEALAIDDQAKIEGRKAYGLSTDPELIQSLPYSAVYNMYLSPEEEAVLEQRFQTQSSVIPQIQQTLAMMLDAKDYLGMYIDQANGGVVNIGIRHGAAVTEVEQAILAAYGEALPIQFYQAHYSEADLNKVMATIHANQAALNIQYASVDFSHQKIMVGITRKHSIAEASTNLRNLTKQDAALFQIHYVDKAAEALAIKASGCATGLSAITFYTMPYPIGTAQCWSALTMGMFYADHTADAEGIVIDKTVKTLTIIWNVSAQDIAAKTKQEILAIAKPNALTVSYPDTSPFAVGDRVAIWTTGAYNESYPAQGVATNIRHREK